MLNLLLRLILTMVALKSADLFLPNFDLRGGWLSLAAFSLVLGLLNWIIKPVLVFFSFPFLIVTIGLFYFVINAFLLYLASLFVPGILDATLPGILFGSILVSVFQWSFSAVLRLKKNEKSA